MKESKDDDTRVFWVTGTFVRLSRRNAQAHFEKYTKMDLDTVKDAAKKESYQKAKDRLPGFEAELAESQIGKLRSKELESLISMVVVIELEGIEPDINSMIDAPAAFEAIHELQRNVKPNDLAGRMKIVGLAEIKCVYKLADAPTFKVTVMQEDVRTIGESTRNIKQGAVTHFAEVPTTVLKIPEPSLDTYAAMTRLLSAFISQKLSQSSDVPLNTGAVDGDGAKNPREHYKDFVVGVQHCAGGAYPIEQMTELKSLMSSRHNFNPFLQPLKENYFRNRSDAVSTQFNPTGYPPDFDFLKNDVSSHTVAEQIAHRCSTVCSPSVFCVAGFRVAAKGRTFEPKW